MGIPRLVDDYVKVSYWTCDVVGHRHATERAALRCIGLRSGERGAAARLARNIEMVERLMAGDSVEAISKSAGCVPSNVAKAVNSALWKAHCDSGTPYPYPWRGWGLKALRRADSNPSASAALAFLLNYMREQEAILRALARVETIKEKPDEPS